MTRSKATAASTTAAAVVAAAVDVPLEVDGEAIPLLGFAQMTPLGAAPGLLLAKVATRWSRRPRTVFTATTMALTVLSCVPDLTITATTATRIVLIASHLVAAAIVIPALAGRLDAR